MSSLASFKSRQLTLIGAFFASLSLATADGAITLTIDSSAQTFSWTGSATSDPFVVAENSFVTIRLGSGTWIGGSLSGTGTDSLDVQPNLPSNTFSAYYFDSIFNGQLILADTRNSFVSELGSIQNFGGGFGSGPIIASVSVNGDGEVYSYADYTDDSKAFLESLNGTQLYFQDERGGAGVFNIGGPAAEIVVIPEPASAALLALGAISLFRRRRCCQMNQGGRALTLSSNP